MSSKTYKRKNTKSKNKKKDIKTLKKINIKRNNRRDKIRSNIRKIRGGGVVSIKWNYITGFLNGIDFDNVNTQNLQGKKIVFRINNETIISNINENLKLFPKRATKQINNSTVIRGTIGDIIKEYDNKLVLMIYYKFNLVDNTTLISSSQEFIVCKTKNNNCKNDLYMYEIEGIKGKNKTKQNLQVGQKMYLPSPSPSNIYINPNKQPNKQPNNNNFNINLTQFNPKEDYYNGYVENE